MGQLNEDILSAELISNNLGTQIIGHMVLYYPVLTSTMDIARQKALEHTEEGTIIIANEQKAGRGRLKRSWLTPSGNIALSVVLYPRLSNLPSIIMIASLAVVKSIDAITGIKACIKWPNDVLIGTKKVCGILIETDARPTSSGHTRYAIIGIGLNVNLRPSDFPEVQSTATSLSGETGTQVSRLWLVRYLLNELDKQYLGLKSGVSPYEAWRDSLVTLGQHIRVTGNEGFVEGVAESVSRDGSLIVRCQGGSVKEIVAGDVTLKQ
jgi:BirA family transcriptional regulator, biotin operon repressor / biotin---[acetyl-CoA-carboxylase] ligase